MGHVTLIENCRLPEVSSLIFGLGSPLSSQNQNQTN
jgi:hypothetical protein